LNKPMLRTLRDMIVIIAVANVLAAVCVLGWLAATHRLSAERVHALRSLFADPVHVEEARKKAEQEQAEEEARLERERAMIGTIPITADMRLSILRENQEVARQQTERLQRETSDLMETLRRERAALDAMVAEFKKKEAAFESMRSLIAERETSDQFRSTLKVLEGMKPRESSDVLNALIESGKIEQAVAYIDAMSPRNASRVLAEFRAQDPRLAADLLERLRQFGIVAQTDEQEAGS
jgi:flagellar motility protein MotE (MotC chaperone)